MGDRADVFQVNVMRVDNLVFFILFLLIILEEQWNHAKETA